MTGLVVADADALVALSLEDDPHHDKAVKISKTLLKQNVTIIYPVTVFPETITFLKRALNQSQKAHAINKSLQAGMFNISYSDANILKLATEYFDKANSKKNTFFDAIVAATAKSLEADLIFSFDDWYPKLGFKLAG
jgi:predicted nucleic acid-binding protein